MAETLQLYEQLGDRISDFQYLASIGAVTGIDTLNCMSQDGNHYYSVACAAHNQQEIQDMSLQEIARLQEWSLVRVADGAKDGGTEVIHYDILADEDGALFFAATRHNIAKGTDPSDVPTIINKAVISQIKAGLANPDIRDYADFDNALADLKRYSNFMLLLQSLSLALPCTLQELTALN